VKEPVLYFGEPILFLALAAIFILLFVVISKVLKEVSFFKGNAAVIIALCVSLLSIIGFSQLVAGGDGLREVNNKGGRAGNILEFILLPYTVLGIAIILLLFIAFIAKIFRGEKVKKYSEEIKCGRMKQHCPLESASKARKKSNEEGHIRK